MDTYYTMNYRKVMTKLNENNVTYVIQTMTSMNYFDSSRKNLTYIFEWKSVIIEMHVITRSTNLHVYSSFPTLIIRR
jgi:hypothetical protein